MFCIAMLLLHQQERVVHDSQQVLESKNITASSLRHRLSNLKCTLATELEGVSAGHQSCASCKYMSSFPCNHVLGSLYY